MPNEKKHTPGPWELTPTVHTGRKNIFGTAKNLEYHVSTLVSGSRNDLAIFKANAHLIAAAPELLEALETAERIIRDYVEEPELPEMCSMAETRDICQEAIAKAKGKEQ